MGYRFLPVLACVSCVLAASTLARAEIKMSAPSLEGLARATSAEKRCQSLNANERLELERYAESRRAGESAKAPKIAQDIYDRGTATGSKARCDSTTKLAIKAVLEASRRAPNLPPTSAVSDIAAKVPVTENKDEEPAQELPNLPAKKQLKKSPAAKSATKQSVKGASGTQVRGLADYGSMVEAYYRELRCPTMSPSGVNGFYRDVMRAHHRSIQIYGTAAVSTAVRRAEARANAGSC